MLEITAWSSRLPFRPAAIARLERLERLKFCHDYP